MAIIVLVLLFNLCSAFVIEDETSWESEPHAELRLPTEYHFKGDVTSLDYGIIRPFEIWYSARHNRSRKDTYGGMVSRYYYGDRRRIYTIHPIATTELVSKTICTAEKSNDEQLKNFLPSLPSKEVVYSGKTMYDNQLVDLWTYSNVRENDLQLVIHLLVVKNEKYHIPIACEEKVLSLRKGLIINHVITRYYGFREPSLNDVTYKDAEEYCVLDESAGLVEDVSSDVAEAFQRYKNHHNKKYYDGDEEELRALVFKRNWRLVTEHNSGNVSYTLGLNKFSDRLPSELVHLTATRPGVSHPPDPRSFPFSTQELQEMSFRLPKNYDMRIDGTISAVKEQADCGSCYAFATVAAVEGALARKNASWNLDLSEQSLVVCSWSEKNHGCNGGYLDAAFEYVKQNGIPTEMEYGIYLAEEGVCKYNIVTKVTNIKNFTRVPCGSLAMKAVLYNYGPVASSINAMDQLKFYDNGIFYHEDCNNNATNHAVTVVGYGEKGGTPYWIVKNSWGEDWGQAGYMFLSAENNNCRILDDAYFVTV